VDKYSPDRDFTPKFVAKVSDWINERGEVFIVLRYLRAAGAKDFLFCRSTDQFLHLVESLPIGTDTTVLEQPQLPLRGVCSESFIEKALQLVPDGGEYLVARLHFKEPRRMCISGTMGDTHVSLREDLQDFLDEEIAVGPCPNFIAADHGSMISASKGGIDGPR